MLFRESIEMDLILIITTSFILFFIALLGVETRTPTYRQRQNKRKLKRWLRGIKREGENVLLPFAFGLLIITIVAIATINLG
tara:strand:+ start:184 stop:429 length:246 start_codon:yes stop_codon:yes gene_type:complete